MQGSKYIEHPLIKPETIFWREYQVNIARKAVERNVLVVLPTGLGKTTIALLTIAELLRRDDEWKVLFLAPTKPLVEQHYKYFRDRILLDPREMVIMTGEKSPSDREPLWNRSKIIFATPQVVLNDILAERAKLGDKCVVVFDEAHRAVGNHPYVRIATLIAKSCSVTRFLGLTASPGSKEKVEELKRNLLLDLVLVRTREDEDVRPYVKEISMKLVMVNQDEVTSTVISLIKKLAEEAIGELNQICDSTLSLREITFTKLKEFESQLEDIYWKGEIDRQRFRKARLLINALIKIDKLMSYAESYSFSVLNEYIKDIKEKADRRGTSPDKWINSRSVFEELSVLVKELVDKGYTHPKIAKVQEIVDSLIKDGKRVLIFVGLRSVAKEIADKLRDRGVNAKLLIGQREGGMKQKDQVRVVEEFKLGKINPLIATQVGEEGLDIAECNSVIFYDNPVSAIRRIQRMGRTGRIMPGEAFFIVLRASRDEGRYWAGLKRQRELEEELKIVEAQQSMMRLTEFIKEEKEKQEEIKVIVDHRELKSKVIDFLKIFGVEVEVESLPIADYIVSEEVCVERKTISDLVDSIIDGRVFSQAREMTNCFEKPIMIIEGDLREGFKRIGENQLTGAILSIIMDFRIGFLITRDERETAIAIYNLARREQEKGSKPKIKIPKKRTSIEEIQLRVVASLPGINYTLAERLLEKFETVERVFTAPLNELMKVKGIGEKTATKIREVLTRRFKSEKGKLD